MISDGFGDHDDGSEVLVSYDRWLHKVANSLLQPTDEGHDDLVQEGRIAMWKALSQHDPALGALPSWLTTAAAMRMKDFAFGHGQPTGRQPTRGQRDVETTPVLDEMIEEGLEFLLGVCDELDGIEIAYHQGEIAEALASLSPAQRTYVYARFWCGLDPSSRVPEMKECVDSVPELRKRWLWTGSSRSLGARDRLAEALVHLAPEYV